MNDPFISEIMIASFNFAPKGWALCNGQFLPINQNQALFSLLGTTYGGNGQTTFALPDFRGRIPIHTGNGHVLGEAGGSESQTLTVQELAQHIHPVTPGDASMRAGTTANITTPEGNYFATNAAEPKRFSNRADASLANASPILGNTGGNQPHSNMQPYLVLNFVIALIGIFPSRD